MDKVNIRILDYIHGLLDERESQAFLDELEKDPALKKLYHTQLNIHKALIQAPLASAPADLVDNVLLQVQERKLSTQVDLFSGVRNIIIGSIAALGVLSIASCFFLPQSNNVESITLIEPYIQKLIKSLSSLELIFNNPSVVVMAIAMPVLLLLDKSYNMYRRKAYALNK
jgi:hypothetical protein